MNLLPDYIKSRLQTFQRQNTLRLQRVRDLCFPVNEFEIEYSHQSDGNLHIEHVGVFILNNLILEKPTGRLFIRPDKAFWPICIVESSRDDHQSLSIQYQRFKCPSIPDDVTTCSYDRPIILFNITKKKRNYYHFMAENATHLVAALEHSPQPADILVEANQPQFVEEFFEIILKRYGAKVHYYEPSGYVAITSPIVIIEDVIKRYYGNFSPNIDKQLARISGEAGKLGNGYTSINSITPIFGQHVSPRRWEIRTSEETISTKNGSILFLPSKTSLQLLRDVVSTVFPTDDTLKSNETPIVSVISRRGETLRGHNIENEESLLEAIPASKGIKFGSISLIDQIRVAQKTNILIGVTGSGLANMIYMKTGSLIIEIAPAKKCIPASDLLETLAHLCGYKYSRVYASSLNASRDCLLSPQAIKEIRVLSAAGIPSP